MAKLTYRKRQHLRSSQFAIPSKRKYPIPDIAHGRNALARVARYGSPPEKRIVRSRVHARYPSIRCALCGSSSHDAFQHR